MGRTSKDKRDIYYRKAKELGFRARSAFKIIQLDEKFNLFEGKSRIVDLCAAPGGWSQVIARRVHNDQDPSNLAKFGMHDNQELEHLSSSTVQKRQKEAQIVAVDLMEMADMEGVHQIKGDITSKSTVDKIIGCFYGKKAQIVVSDGAPDVLGLHDLDEYLQAQLVLAALNISLYILEEGGSFVAKVFRGKDVSLLYSQLAVFFKSVVIAKPKASRNSSFEAFVVCTNFRLPEDYNLSTTMETSLLDFTYNQNGKNARLGPDNFTVPFIACGDVDGYDADQSYPIDELNGYVHIQPIQLPINPPYASSISKSKLSTRKKSSHLD